MENTFPNSVKNAGGGRVDPSLFRDLVSDSILGRRAWRVLPEEEKRLLKLDENPILLREPVSFWSFDVLRSDLPFYPDTRLLEIRYERGTSPVWCLERDGAIFKLDTEVSGRLLHDTAEIAPLTLTQDNLLEYLRFFCFFVHGAAGPFFIVDGLDHPVWDATRLTAEESDFLGARLARPQILSASDDGHYTIRASVVYADMAYNATFQVSADGAVEMTDDQGIAGELPVRVLKPDYRIELKSQRPDEIPYPENRKEQVMNDQNDMSMGDFKKAAKKKVVPVALTAPEGADREEAEAAVTAFLERVSDSIFGRRDWAYLSEAESRKIGVAAEKAIFAGMEMTSAELKNVETACSACSFEVKRFPLSFYENATLLEIRKFEDGVGGGSTWLLDNEGTYYPLNGDSAPIHDVNDAAPIRVTRENVLDYLRFFCFFVHGDEGPFFIVDSLDHPVFLQDKLKADERKSLEAALRAPEILGVSAEGIFNIDAVVMYGNALFKSKFAVKQEGLIEMIDDEPVAGDIPALKLKTDY